MRRFDQPSAQRSSTMSSDRLSLEATRGALAGRRTPSTGLSAEEARRRLSEVGPNRFVERERWSEAVELLRTLADPMALMLAAGSLIYVFLGDTRDALILAIALVPVLGIDVLLEARSRKALAKLASAVAPRAIVLRDGREQEIDTEAIVPGDLIVLREGSVVHADGIVLQSSNLALDESQLTGESEPQRKRSALDSESNEEDARFYAGSMVLAGNGLGEVETTGRNTRFGDISRLVAETETRATPLQNKISRIVKQFLVAAALVVLIVILLERWRGTGWGTALISGVSLAMSAAPEEFPLVFTLFLALGAWRLSRRGVLVRRLASVETLGSTSVICVDKTGTITHGQFQLEHHAGIEPGVAEEAVLEAAALACELDAVDPLERAILAHCREHGIDVAALHRRWELVYDYDFDPLGKHMSHVWRATDGNERIAAKGALEGVLEHCRSTSASSARADAALSGLASQGMRVLAVAGRRAPRGSSFTGRREVDERDLELLGLIGFRDPLRAGVPAAIAQCRSAGIAVKLITGDHALTAHAIASAAGITSDGETEVVLGSEIDSLPPEELGRHARRDSVFARIRPEQKLAIVRALQLSGDCVAMTGDGINDAPALRRADIGISLGAGATEVARNAADLVLLDNDFAALVSTVREGRAIFANIQRAFLYLIAFHIPVVGLALAAPLLGWPLLLLPVHIVWLELIVHPVSALLFEDMPPPPDAMSQPPRRADSPLLQRAAIYRSVISGLLITMAALWMYASRVDVDVLRARSMALTVVIAGNLILVWAERAMDRPWWKVEIPRGPRFWLVWLAVAASLPLCMQVSFMEETLEIAPLTIDQWAAAIGTAVLCVAWRFFGVGARRSSDYQGSTKPS
jgi:Ca2+-transporting ATPase